MNIQEFIKHANSVRLATKDRWYQVEQTVDGNLVRIKAYNTWVQLMYIGQNGINYASPMGMNVGEFKTHLSEALEPK